MNKFRKQVAKINIYDGPVVDAEKITDKNIRNLFETGRAILLKPVEHNGTEYPVTLIVDDFSYIDILSFWDEKLSLSEAKISDDEKNVKRFMSETFTQIIMFALPIGGGAAASLIEIPKSKAELFGKEPGNPCENMRGFAIVVDKRLGGYIKTDLNTIVHHEYFHLMAKGGHISKCLSESKLNFRLTASTAEERAADKFAKINTGHQINMSDAMGYSYDIFNSLSTLKGREDRPMRIISKVMKVLYSPFMRRVNAILQGRK